MYPLSLKQVEDFHITFNHPIHHKPHVTDKKLNKLRVSLLKEEVKELEEALEAGDEVAALDALTDIQFVLDGAYLALGFASAKTAASFEVFRSNMSKLGKDGRPIYREDGKVLKGPNYKKPDLKTVIKRHYGKA